MMEKGGKVKEETGNVKKGEVKEEHINTEETRDAKKGDVKVEHIKTEEVEDVQDDFDAFAALDAEERLFNKVSKRERG